MKPVELLVAPSFEDRFVSLKSDLPQSIILSGQTGVGLGRLATELSGSNPIVISQSEATKTTRGTIGIETVRGLYAETRSGSTDGRAIIIDDADLMSEPAQNAFLKLLEEPASGVHFILTTHHPDKLLPTIRSRAQIINVPQISAGQSKKLLKRFNLDAETSSQLLFVASGLPAELIRLAQSPKAKDELVQTMRDARVILGPNRYQAFYTALNYADNISRSQSLLVALKKMIEHSIAHSSDPLHIKRLEQIISVNDNLQRNANPRIQLAKFVIQYH